MVTPGAASPYVTKFQSRRSLLVWKIYGQRLDGWTNDDFPTDRVPGDANTLEQAGHPVPNTQANRDRADLDFTGSAMPPPEAVKAGKAQPLSDEDRRTIVRWIDLGCPIDFDYDPSSPDERGYGWMADDKRPTLALAAPRAGANESLDRIVIGAFDYYSGLDAASLTVTADFAIDGIAAGENLAAKFTSNSSRVWEWKLSTPITDLPRGKLAVSVKDQQGNITRIERTLFVEKQR
jgi:hypothetical protein